jgi:hypothetical protein
MPLAATRPVHTKLRLIHFKPRHEFGSLTEVFLGFRGAGRPTVSFLAKPRYRSLDALALRFLMQGHAGTLYRQQDKDAAVLRAAIAGPPVDSVS